MNESDLRRFNEAVSFLHRVGKLQECFHPDHSACKGKIKQAHSIQMNGRLSLLESGIGGQRRLYSLGKFDLSDPSGYPRPKLLGKKQASTFTGFCDYHDKTIFKPIEDEMESLSDRQLFLHSYRSYAFWYHTLRELMQAVVKDSKFDIINDVSDNFLTSNIRLAIESQGEKQKLNDLLVYQHFDKLIYYVHTTQHTHLVASSDVVIPFYYLDNQPLYSPSDVGIYSKVMLTVLPGEKNTIIIMACFPDDTKAIKFITDFRRLPAKKFEQKVSSLLIYSHGNTFISPKLWNQITDLDKSILLSDINNLHYEESTGETLYDRYFDSNVNLFSYPPFPMESETLE